MNQKYVYHGSSVNNLTTIEPRAVTKRNPNEGPVVFATHDEVSASKFIVPSDDSWSQLSKFNDIHVAIYANKDTFLALDRGGSIYTLPGDQFSIDKHYDRNTKELTCQVSVRVISEKTFTTGLSAMLGYGVQVYFVTIKQFKAMQDSEDHGFTILRRIISENCRLGINSILL